MIRLLKRNQIDEEKYNQCISNSLQSRISAYSWYLDIVADDWSVLILNDYEAVMPLPIREKYKITYVYPPFWLLELGVFSRVENCSIDDFITALFKNFNFVELRLNLDNQTDTFDSKKHLKSMQLLSLSNSYKSISSNYNRNRKRELKKAESEGLIEKWNDSPDKLIALFKKNVGERVAKLKEKEYQTLLKLLEICIEKNVGEVLSIYDKDENLVGSTFFLKHQHTVTNLVSTTDFNNRNNGVNTFFNDRAIYKYQKEFDVFHFGGSSLENIANYYKSFGAETKNYFLLKKRLV
jgi:hypothetical protein